MEKLLRDYRRLREEVVPQSNARLETLGDLKVERREERDQLKNEVERVKSRARLRLRRERDAESGELLYVRVADLDAAIAIDPGVAAITDELADAETAYIRSCVAYDVERKQSSIGEDMVTAFPALATAHSTEIWAERDATRSHP
jgi:hypothetical protein